MGDGGATFGVAGLSAATGVFDFAATRGGREGKAGREGNDVAWKEGRGGSSRFISETAACLSRHLCSKSSSLTGTDGLIEAAVMELLAIPPAISGLGIACKTLALGMLVMARALSACAEEERTGALTTLAAGPETGRWLCCFREGSELESLLTFVASVDEDGTASLAFSFFSSFLIFKTGFSRNS